MLGQIGWFAFGAVLLLLGADSLVKGAAGLALRLRLKPHLVGLLVLGFGTALPELALTLDAVRGAHTGLALGNAVGSAIANLGLVLGVAALAAPFATGLALTRWLLPAVIAIAVLVGLLALDGALDRLDGAVLVLAFVVVLGLLPRLAAREAEPVRTAFAAAAEAPSEPWRFGLRITIGLAVLTLGVHFAVDAAAALAMAWGLSELIVGLSLVAIGTLMPELATAVLAARRGHGDLAVGNAIGGAFANLSLVLGAGALWRSLPVPSQLLQVELPALVAFALALYPMLRGDAHLTRREGAVLLAAYLAFLGWQACLAFG